MNCCLVLGVLGFARAQEPLVVQGSRLLGQPGRLHRKTSRRRSTMRPSRLCLRIQRPKPIATASRPCRFSRREERTNNGKSTPMRCVATNGRVRRDGDSPAIVPAVLKAALRLKRYDEAVRYVLLPGKLGPHPLQLRQLGVHLPNRMICPGRGRL